MNQANVDDARIDARTCSCWEACKDVIRSRIIGTSEWGGRGCPIRPSMGRRIQDRIRGASSCIGAEHHGDSSRWQYSGPGTVRQPILDILITVPDLAAALKLVPELAALNYEYRRDADIMDRHYFRRGRGAVWSHHLSIAESSSHFHRVTLAFRNALRSNAALAREYCALKRELARRFSGDRARYLDGKSTFVARVLREAGEEVL
jgi:GrpB-like predicted nucleotidyltransferase (UPF0157 family)